MRTTEQDKERYLEALKTTLGNITEACNLTKINRMKYYYWIEHDDKFKQDCADVEKLQFDFVENALMKKIKQGSEPSIHFFLKTKGRKIGYGTSVEVNANLSGTIDIKGLIGFEDDEGEDTSNKEI